MTLSQRTLQDFDGLTLLRGADMAYGLLSAFAQELLRQHASSKTTMEIYTGTNLNPS